MQFRWLVKKWFIILIEPTVAVGTGSAWKKTDRELIENTFEHNSNPLNKFKISLISFNTSLRIFFHEARFWVMENILRKEPRAIGGGLGHGGTEIIIFVTVISGAILSGFFHEIGKELWVKLKNNLKAIARNKPKSFKRGLSTRKIPLIIIFNFGNVTTQIQLTLNKEVGKALDLLPMEIMKISKRKKSLIQFTWNGKKWERDITKFS